MLTTDPILVHYSPKTPDPSISSSFLLWPIGVVLAEANGRGVDNSSIWISRHDADQATICPNRNRGIHINMGMQKVCRLSVWIGFPLEQRPQALYAPLERSQEPGQTPTLHPALWDACDALHLHCPACLRRGLVDRRSLVTC